MNSKFMIITLLIGLVLSAVYVYGLDYPHTNVGTSGQKFINCADCHFSHGDPLWAAPPTTIDETFYNNQCWSCHDDSRAPYRKTHSSNTISTTYGNWTVECWECHDAHEHEQLDADALENNRYLYEGTVSNITINSPVAGQSTIIDTSPGWANGDFDEDVTNKDFYVIVPNTAEDYYVYKILSTQNTNEIIVEGIINTTYAPPGSTMRIYLSKNVRETINAPDRPTCTYDDITKAFTCTNKIPKTVKFKDWTGTHSFADGDATLDGVCEVCHTQTNYHRNTAIGNHEHNKELKCSDCHIHVEGFKVDPAICSTCHGNPPREDVANEASTNQDSGLVDYNGSVQSPTPNSTGSTTAGAHARHVDTEGFGCPTCHFGSAGSGSTHNSGLSPTLGFSLFSGFYQGGNYDGQASVGAGYDTSTTNPATTVTQNDNLTCSTIYCHSDVQPDTGLGAMTYSTPVWDDTVDPKTTAYCGTCHLGDGSSGNAGNGTYMNTGTHNTHIQVQTYACSVCHFGAGSGTIAHPDNNIDVSFDPAINPSGVYSQAAGNKPGNAYGFCSTLDCHGPGTPKWGDSNPDGCTWCHGNDALSTDPMALLNHTEHMNNESVIGDNFDCGECHADTVTVGNNTTITGSVHANGTKNVVFESGRNPSGSWATNTCTTVYCHSTGKDGDFAATSLPGAYGDDHYTGMTWNNTTNLKCYSCHGKTTTTGHPDYTNGGAGTGNANSHVAHVVNKGYNCSVCHSDTTDDGVTIKSGSLHLNGAKDIAIAAAFDTNGGASGNYSGQQCSATLCHGTGASPQWGGSVGGGCSACHQFPPSTGAHTAHIQNSVLLTEEYGNTEVASDGSNYAFGCGNCHPSAAEEATLHQNGTVDLSLDPDDGGTLKSLNAQTESFNQTTGVSVDCSSVYCHSNGYDNGNGLTYKTTPEWFGGNISGNCTDCHGNSPNTNTIGSATHAKHVVGIHYNNIYTGSTGLLTEGTGNNNSHGNATYSTTINCNMCHYNTVQTFANDNNETSCSTVGCHGAGGTSKGSASIANRSNHVNGTVDVAFNTINIRSKAQIREIDSTAPELNNNWERTTSGVAYKAAGAYDQSISALNTGTMYDANDNTCSSVACHNGNTATWGDVGVNCFYCHKVLPETPTP